MGSSKRAMTAAAGGLLLALMSLVSVAHGIPRSMRVGGFMESGIFNLSGSVRATRRLHQLPHSPSAQIFLDGILQAATLDASCSGSPTCGGTLTVNGEVVLVPKNMMVMFPANALTWQEIFQTANGGTGTQTNLALQDNPPPSGGVTYSVSVAANQVGTDIIAALIDISQLSIVGGSGYIDFINYGLGELSVAINGGTGAKVRINDPTGRFGMAQAGAGFDPRFVVDPDNPTIASATGFPMCIPRGAATGDALCPDTNRPVPAGGIPQTLITMGQPDAGTLDPKKMAPFMVGDYITFSGVLTSSGFIAAYSISNNVAIFTLSGVDPAYTTFETALIGTGGLNVLGAGEAAVRSRFEGSTTDPSRPVQLWGLDFNPADGTFTQRSYGEVMPDPGPPIGAAMGRWRFRPPCTTAGPLTPASPYLGNKGCTAPAGGVYTPPTREVMVNVKGCNSMPGVANGIASGGCSYRNPTIEYIWPENIPGTPIVENNFQVVPFLTKGGYTSAGGTRVSTLSPWPSNNLPQDSCLPPTITVTGSPYTVSSGGMVTVSADVSGPGAPFGYKWTGPDGSAVACGDPPNVTPFSSGAGSTVSSTCGPITVDGTSLTLTVTNYCTNQFQATAKANLAPLDKPQAIQAIAPVTVASGAAGVALTAKLSGTTPQMFKWAVPAGVVVVQDPSEATPTTQSKITFAAPTNALPSITPMTMTFTTNTFTGAGAGVTATSDTVSAVVTVSPTPDKVTITAVAFRCDKHRMSITATSSINNPSLKLWMDKYTDNAGNSFDPSAIGNTLTYGFVAGIATYTVTIEPVRLPSMSIASLNVRSGNGGSDTYKVLATDVKGTCTI